MYSKTVILAACLFGALSACGDDAKDNNDATDSSVPAGDSGSKTDASAKSDAGDQKTGDDAGADADAGAELSVSRKFVLGTAIFGEEPSFYTKVVDNLDFGGASLEVDKTWREFTGYADIWVSGESVFVAPGTAPEVIKFSVGANNKLTGGDGPDDKISFGDLGITSTAFYHSTFVSETKAYMGRDAAGIVAWNPSTMEIGKEVPYDLEDRGDLLARVGFADRASRVVDGKVYQTAYWADMTYSQRADDSLILVTDSDTDKVVDRIPVPDCSALDHATLDDDGNIWFSPWTGGAGTFYVLDQAPTCIAKLDTKTGDITTTLFSDITGGHQGAAFQYVGNGKFVMSVFDEVIAGAVGSKDYTAVVAKLAWRLWSYDSKTGEAAPIEDVALNSGAMVHTIIDGTTYSLIPGENYATSTVYRLDAAGKSAEKVFDVNGWSYRLFGIK